MLDAAANADLIDEIRIGIDNKTLELPTLPEGALEIRDAVENDSADAHMVARMVAKDPALSARLLQVANSPLYRGSSEVDPIQQAIPERQRAFKAACAAASRATGTRGPEHDT